MSWLIDLAGKAEHYLDKIDQNTAVVLQNQKEKPLKDIFKYFLVFIHLFGDWHVCTYIIKYVFNHINMF